LYLILESDSNTSPIDVKVTVQILKIIDEQIREKFDFFLGEVLKLMKNLIQMAITNGFEIYKFRF
jgi:hypothetical protein